MYIQKQKLNPTVILKLILTNFVFCIKGHLLEWSKSLVENKTKAFQAGKLVGAYGKAHVDAIRSILTF